LASDDFIDRLYEQIRNDSQPRKTIKMVHFTDIHMDLKYVKGASTKCGDVICCREADGFPTDPALQAGPLGSFGCDIPVDVVTEMGDFINREVRPDVILWGGDVTPHDQNSYSFDYVAELQTRLADFFAANLSSYELYPLEGNHDFVVPNSQDFSKPDPILALNMQLWA
jgi:sphingomyelin phosphodiesterase